MRLGFIGVGAINSAIVTGLKSGPGAEWFDITLSARNPERAAELARLWPGVVIAASNQAVLEASDVVVIGVRPQVAREVLGELRFHRSHSVISLVSGLPIGALSEITAPARQVCRAVPLPLVARRRCPTPIFPDDSAAQRIFSVLGSCMAAGSEHEFDVFCSATSTIATYFAFASGVAGWLTQHGVDEAQARDYFGQILSGVADEAIQAPERSFPELAADHATRGGTNEQLLNWLRSNGVFDTLSEGLDAILQRVTAASR